MEPLLFAFFGEVTADESEVGNFAFLFRGELEVKLAPSFVLEPHPFATGLEEELDFGFAEGVITNGQVELKIKPVHPGGLEV